MTNIALYFLSFALPGFVLFMINTYWIFPLKEKNSFFNLPLIARLLICSIVLILPFSFIVLDFGSPSTVFSISAGPGSCCRNTRVLADLPADVKERIFDIPRTSKGTRKIKSRPLFLRSQINPHFLFNTLNTLYGTSLQEGADNTAQEFRNSAI